MLKNKKGTAEVVGSVMFIVILLFFFTNVYLWHDAATKEMNQLYVDRINTPVTLSITQDKSQLNVTAAGGSDATLSMVWVVVELPSGGPNQAIHLNFPRTDVVPAGKSILIPIFHSPSPNTIYKVVTTTGNTASCSFP
jgi:hypothetical protein